MLLSSNNAGCRFLVALEGFLPAEAAATSSQDDETLVSEAAPALPGRPFLVGTSFSVSSEPVFFNERFRSRGSLVLLRNGADADAGS